MAESDFNFDRWERESNGKNEWFKIKMETK